MTHVLGPLYYERTGRVGPVIAFLPPNPMDQACWLYQMQHFSTWFRCIAIDTPGYGRSPGAEEGVTFEEIAEAFWAAVDEVEPTEKVILVGCSGGYMYALKMQQLRPERSAAIILSGCGILTINGVKDDPRRHAEPMTRVEQYNREGAAFRYRHALGDYSPAFNATPMARYFVSVFTERNGLLDIATIQRQFMALAVPDPGHPEGEPLQLPQDSVLGGKAPTLIVSGTEDEFHAGAFLLRDKIEGSEIEIVPGAGHACYMEQPWLFDDIVIAFLEKHGLMQRSEPARQ